MSSAQNNLKVLATAPVTCEVGNVDRAIFATNNNRFFAHANNKFLGTFNSRDEARDAVTLFSQEKCLALKRAVLHY